MKIYYVSDARLPTEKAHGLAIMKTCEALTKNGADVELIVPNRINKMLEDPFTYYGIKVKFPVTKLFTLDLVRFGRFGFLIQEVTFAIAAARYLRGKTGVIYSRDEVVLWTLNLFGYKQFLWESHTGGWNMAARTVARNTEALVVISQGLKEFYAGHGISGEKIFIIRSAIDLEDFADTEEKRVARARLGLPQEVKLAMYIGRLDGWKGSATLLEASTLVPENVRVVVIGGDTELVASLKLTYPRVTFLGLRPYRELPNNQAAADVLVVPNTGKDEISARFTSPLKVVAHMASGRPVVASDLPSIRELTGDDAAYLVAADDPQALADGIVEVLNNREKADRLVAHARMRVQGFTWDTRAKKIVEVIGSFPA